jgi:hypothetical protein
MVLVGRAGNNQIPFDNLIFNQAPAWNSTLNVTSALSSTLTNEFIFGASQNNPDTRSDGRKCGELFGHRFHVRTAVPGVPGVTVVQYHVRRYHQSEFWWRHGLQSSTHTRTRTPTFDIYDNVSKVFGTHYDEGGLLLSAQPQGPGRG